MTNIEHNFSNLRSPLPTDNFIDYPTWKPIVDYFRSLGFDESAPPLREEDIIKERTFARIGLRVRTQNASGKIPDETPVFMYEGVEVRWDSSTNGWVTKTGGLVWNGAADADFDQNYLRLVGQPGFGNANYEYGPLLYNAVVPVFLASENAYYSSSSENGANITLDTSMWCIVYPGTDPVVHPFKCRLNASNVMQIDVGYMRDYNTNAGDGTDAANISHTGPDLISFISGIANADVIELTTVDTVTIPTSTTEGYVYYEYNDSSTPTFDAKFSAVWPPDPDPQTYIFPVCYVKVATINSVEQVFTIGQLQFSQKTFSLGGNTTAGVSVTDSVVKVNNVVQLNLDVDKNADATRDAIQAVLGGESYGPDIYGGKEDPGYFTRQRKYVPLCNPSNLDNSMLQPHDEGDAAHTNANLLWIQLVNTSKRLGKQIQHGRLTQALADLTKFQSPLHPAAGFYVIDIAALAALPPATTITAAVLLTLVKIAKFDSTGHLVFYDGNYYSSETPTTPPIDPSIDSLITLTLGSGYPSSAGDPFFNVQIAQETNITDGAGVDTVAFNVANGLSYKIRRANNDIVRSNKTDYSTLTAFMQDSVAWNGGGTGGSNAAIYSNLAKVFNEPLIYTVKLIATGAEAQDTLDTADVYLSGVSINGGADIQSGVAFTVEIEVLDGNGGARQDLFDGGEHQIKVIAKYGSDDTAIATNFVDITADTPSAGKSGISTSFTINIPAERLTDAETICIDAVLYWTGNVNAPGLEGDTNVSNLDVLCANLDGAATVTTDLTLAADLYDPTGTEGTIGGISMVTLSQSVLGDYTIQVNAANTTNYSTAAATATVELYDIFNMKVPFEIDNDGDSSTTKNVNIINPVDGTDGYQLNITSIKTDNVQTGEQLEVRILTGGTPIASDTFMFSAGLFYWDDSYDTTTADSFVFPWSDFGGGDDLVKSTALSGEPFNSRWNIAFNSWGSGVSINPSSELVFSGTTSGADLHLEQTLNVNGDFLIEIKFKDYSAVSPGSFARAALILITVGGNDYAIFRTENGEASTTDGYVFEKNASYTKIEQSDSSGKITLKRVGSDLTFQVNDVIQRTETETGTLTSIDRVGARHGNDTNQFDSTLYDFTFKVGSDLDNYNSASLDRWTETNDTGINYVELATGYHIQEFNNTQGTIILDNLFTDGSRPDITSETWKFGVHYVDLGLPSAASADIRQFMELGNVALGSDAFRFGYYADNSTLQTLYLDINGTNVFEELDGSSSAELYVERGDFTFSDFGGSVSYSSQKSTGLEGTSIFDSRWTRTNVINDPNSETLVGDIINIILEDRDTQIQGVNYNGNFANFDSPFSISCDMAIGGFTTSSPTVPKGMGIQLLVTIGGDVCQFGWVQNASINGLGYYDGSTWTELLSQQDGGSWNFEVNRNSLNLVTFTISGDNSYSATFTKSGIISNWAIAIDNGGGSSGTGTVGNGTATNFIALINGSEYTEKRVLFSKETKLKYAYDDSNSAVDHAQIKFDSSYNNSEKATCTQFTFESPTGTRYVTAAP